VSEGVGSNLPLVLITGANGFVGSRLAPWLASSGKFRVRTLSRFRNFSFPEQVDQSVVAHPFDAAVLAGAVNGVDVVIHCAGRAHVMGDAAGSSLQSYRDINVDYSLRLARAAVSAGVKRFIYLSSVKVNGECTDGRAPFHPLDTPKPEDAYGLSKWEAEQALSETLGDQCELVVVRPPLIYGEGVKGNFARLQAAIIARRPLPLGLLKNNRSLISLPNLVDFIECCLTHPQAAGRVFIPCDQRDFSVREMVRQLAYTNNVRPLLLPVPVWCLKLAGRLLGRSEAVGRLCGSLRVDHAHTADWLGWSAPFTPFEKTS
jgi:nucleoside-diphosphate-sugar epimerase